MAAKQSLPAIPIPHITNPTAVALQTLVSEMLRIGIIVKPSFIRPALSASAAAVPLQYRQFAGVDVLSSLELAPDANLRVQVTPALVASAHTYGVTHLTSVRSLQSPSPLSLAWAPGSTHRL